ncbi:MAG TPA: succinate dehydrogenase/fumarate reductase iron-sulfur subunit [Lacipirellulaceae bacterium]|nr:succinate dehydrogenase/fumarate reductase iron-sulfur subunit [Lacipirellulaceae bacterium]
MAEEATLRIYRGDNQDGQMVDYKIPVAPGMVVLDAVHAVQAMHSPDLAVRWNCKAGKCGSCSAEVNGKPRLMCMDRMDKYPAGEPITIRPVKSFPVMKDLACDVSWNYEVNKKIPPFKMRRVTSPLATSHQGEGKDEEPRFSQAEADRVQEFRKCIECFLCQNVCHVLREHQKYPEYGGPRFFVRVASLEMHPLDAGDRLELVKDQLGLGYCNITYCCTEVCPESIKITNNAIIPLKERVVDRFYDPVKKLLRVVFPKKS